MFIKFHFVNSDFGREHPTVTSPTARHVASQFDVIAPYQEGSENEEEIVRNIEGLTHRIPEYAWMRDIPCQYQRHTVGVSYQIH